MLKTQPGSYLSVLVPAGTAAGVARCAAERTATDAFTSNANFSMPFKGMMHTSKVNAARFGPAAVNMCAHGMLCHMHTLPALLPDVGNAFRG